MGLSKKVGAKTKVGGRTMSNPRGQHRRQETRGAVDGVHAGLHLRRREGSLHLPGRTALDERACPIGSQVRRRPLSTSDRIFHLSSQAPLYTGQAEGGQAVETRRRPRRDASQARPDARRDEHPPADRLAPVRNAQIMDG